MSFKDIEQANTAVNKAWDVLYKRLEKDGLLPGKFINIPNEPKQEVENINTLSNNERGRNPYRLQYAAGKWLSVAAAAIVCIIFGWYLLQKNHVPGVVMQVLYNEINAPVLATTLEDGSVVYLSQQTSLQYPKNFDDDKREVTIQGEAFFDIKKLSDRPFIIHTDIANVKVTGTSFKIKSDQSASFLLSVHEGEVMVSLKSKRQQLTAKTGETVYFDSEQLYLKKNEDDVSDYFQYIHFKDESLVNVATIINHFSDSLQLKVAPSIDQRITFTYTVNGNIAEMVEAICLALNLQQSRQGSNICISKPE